MVGNQHFGWRPLYWTIWSESEIQPIQQFKGQHKFFGPTVGQEFFDWPTVPMDRDVHQNYGEKSGTNGKLTIQFSWSGRRESPKVDGLMDDEYWRRRFSKWPSSFDWPSIFRFGTSTFYWFNIAFKALTETLKLKFWMTRQLKLLFSFIFFVGTSFYHIWNTCFTRKSLFHSFV